MHQNPFYHSLNVSILSDNRVTKSVSDLRGVSPDCKMCVRDTNAIFWTVNNLATVKQYLLL